jgi:SAM-dependent methyltransferase
MSLSDDVAEYYSAMAGEYDVTAGYTDPAAEERRLPIKRRFQKALSGKDVLEIACGTGYWTEVISVTARSVLAVDVNQRMISIARKRFSSAANVRCQVADVYTLNGISGHFTGAFAHWWWSHIPRPRIRTFLTTLHGKLASGAFVLFADQLPYDWKNRRSDEDGNLLEERILANGLKFEIVKNFPSEQEIVRSLSGIAEGVTYREYPEGRYWTVCYNVRKWR